MPVPHILLVEDNEGDIVLTTEALELGKMAHRLSVVRDGKEAIDFVNRENGFDGVSIPDLILLDINLPKLNGHEVLKHIKLNPALKHIPVLMLTTSSSASDINQAYANHANCYITKPVDLADFIALIRGIEYFWMSVIKLPVQ